MTATADAAPVREKPWQQLEEDKRKAEATDVGVKVTTAGVVYEIHFGELSGLDVRALRKQTGYTTFNLLQLVFDGQTDVDVFAAFVWLARRAGGERELTYEDVAGSVRWGEKNTIEFVDAVPDAPPPVRVEGEDPPPQQ